MVNGGGLFVKPVFQSLLAPLGQGQLDCVFCDWSFSTLPEMCSVLQRSQLVPFEETRLSETSPRAVRDKENGQSVRATAKCQQQSLSQNTVVI